VRKVVAYDMRRPFPAHPIAFTNILLRAGCSCKQVQFFPMTLKMVNDGKDLVVGRPYVIGASYIHPDVVGLRPCPIRPPPKASRVDMPGS